MRGKKPRKPHILLLGGVSDFLKGGNYFKGKYTPLWVKHKHRKLKNLFSNWKE